MTAKHWAKIGRRKYEVVIDHQGTVRFPANRIVDDFYMAAAAGRKLDLNDIAVARSRGRYTWEEMDQFYRLIGYSVGGVAELSHYEGKTVDCCCFHGHEKKG